MSRRNPDFRIELPPLELACMKALWALGQGTVHDIRAHLYPARPRAYTTVMTVMDRLAQKGVAAREKRGRAHLYRPAITEARVRDHALDRLVQDFFQGSRERLRDYLAHGSTAPSQPEGKAEVSPKTPASQPVAPGEAEDSIDTSLA